jgi:hypothetical protein
MNNMDKIIKHKDPFLGEIELKEVGRVIMNAFLDENVYYVMESEKYKGRGVDCGIWYKNTSGEMKWMRKEEMNMIKSIYEALTKIEI